MEVKEMDNHNKPTVICCHRWGCDCRIDVNGVCRVCGEKVEVEK